MAQAGSTGAAVRGTTRPLRTVSTRLNGPSFCSSTCIDAPKRPVAVGIPGYVVPTDQSASLYLKSASPVAKIESFPAGALTATPVESSAGSARYDVKASGWGQARLTVLLADDLQRDEIRPITGVGAGGIFLKIRLPILVGVPILGQQAQIIPIRSGQDAADGKLPLFPQVRQIIMTGIHPQAEIEALPLAAPPP